MIITNERELHLGDDDHGDEEFTVEAPEGHIISLLDFGVGGHVHNISGYFSRFIDPPQSVYGYEPTFEI